MKFPYSDPSDIYLIELDAVVSWLVGYRGLQKNCALWLFYLPITIFYNVNEEPSTRLL